MQKLNPTARGAVKHRLYEHIRLLCDLYGADAVHTAYVELQYPFDEHIDKDNRFGRECENIFYKK